MSSCGFTVSRNRSDVIDSSIIARSLKLSTRFIVISVIFIITHTPLHLLLPTSSLLSLIWAISVGHSSCILFMKRKLCLFDVDGTLTKSRNKIEADMKSCLAKLKAVADIGFVGGSDQKKIREQLDEDTIQLSNYFFSENGLLAYRGNELIGKEAIKDFVGEQRLKTFINFCLHYIADLDIPIKRGTFIEYRTGLINVSPIGRNCSPKERDDFEQYDRQHRIRETFIHTLKQQFPDYGLKYSIGGQISFDVFPIGWDKTYCLRYLKDYDEIYFFGDKTEEGGNDHEIYELMRKEGRGFSVKEGPRQTIQLLEELFLK